MSESTFSEHSPGGVGRDEVLSAIFVQMIMQQSQMALMLMGKVPNPETGQTVRDIEGARMFIDQLEMIEAKTKGNLDKNEERLLKQTLMSLRMTFVEAVESPEPEAPRADEAKPESKPAAESTAAPVAEEDSKKKFSKKY